MSKDSENSERIAVDPTEERGTTPNSLTSSTTIKKTIDDESTRTPKETIAALLRDKLTTHQSAFVSTGTNSTSQNEGYFAERSEGGEKHILKHGLKAHPIDLPVPELVGEKPKAILQRRDPAEYKRQLTEYEAANSERKKIIDHNRSARLQRDERRDMVVEYITAKLYNRVLPKRSPKINLAQGYDNGDIYLTSKFYEGFKTLTDLTGASGNGAINPVDPADSSKLHPELAKMKGFEKVIAGCLFAGEGDFHASNLGVVPGFDGDRSAYEVVKIDHGRSGATYEDESSMRASLADSFRVCKYENLPLNASKLKEAIDGMTLVSDREIESMVTNAASELKRQGVEVERITLLGEDRPFDEMAGETRTLSSPELISHKHETFSSIEKYFIDGFKQRREQLKEFARNLGVIEKIDGVTTEWKNGQWLQDLREQDPIQWAIANGKTIEGKDPLIWKAARKAPEREAELPVVTMLSRGPESVAESIRGAITKTSTASTLSGEAVAVTSAHIHTKKEEKSR